MAALGKNRPSPCILHALGYLALAGALGVSLAWLTVGRAGELVPPLDDAYIHVQAARSLGQGHLLEYQPGMGPSRGTTSLLYPLLLSPWTRLPSPAAPVWAAWGLGVLFLAGAAWGADRWAVRVAGPPAGWAAGLLVLASGHFVWGAFSGMEIALYACLLTVSAWAAVRLRDAADPGTGRRRWALLGILLFFLGLARPEGILLGGLIAAGTALSRSPAAPGRGRRWLLLGFPLAACALTVGLNLAAIGSVGSDSLAAKAFWNEPRPDVRLDALRARPAIFLRLGALLFSDFGSRVFGGPSPWILRGLLAAGAGAAAVFAVAGKGDGAVRLLVALVVAGLLGGLVPGDYAAHYHRYQMPYLPLAVMLVVAGWVRLLPRRRWARRGVFLAVGVLLLPGLAWTVNRLPRNAADIHDHQVTMGRWIDGHLPPNARVALNDAGAIAYYGHRPVIDLVGLVTDGAGPAFRAGQGAVFEWLESLPPAARPTHFAVFPAWFPYLERTHLLGAKLLQLTLANNTISGGDVKCVYAADWSRVRSEDPPVVRGPLITGWGFQVMDALDVGDLADQTAHGYAAFDTWRDILREFAVDGNPGTVLIDGGRLPTQGERFLMACFPGEPAALVMRTEAYAGFTLRVSVNGRDLGTWEVPRRELVWTEPLFEIPGDVLTGDAAAVTLTQVDAKRPYPSYQYWLLQ
jgi:hypothetical protein